MIFLIVGELVYQSRNPLNTVIKPKSEKALSTIVLKLSSPLNVPIPITSLTPTLEFEVLRDKISNILKWKNILFYNKNSKFLPYLVVAYREGTQLK